MIISNFKYLKTLARLLLILTVLVLVSCLPAKVMTETMMMEEEEIIDMTPPIITVLDFINGQTTNVENSEGFVIPEAVAVDDTDEEVAVITNDDGYDNDTPAIYNVVYTAIDMASNVSTFTLTVIVEDSYDPGGFDRQTGLHADTGTPYDPDGFDSNDLHVAKPNLKIGRGRENDLFGHSVSISGDYAVIGANEEDANGGNSGAAYIYNRSGTNWTRQTELTADDNSLGDLFGQSVVIDGDHAIVGANYADVSKGAAYVFNRNGDNWSQQAKLTASDSALFNSFGYSVDLDGNYAIVGATEDGIDTGSVYIFIRSLTSWDQQAKLIATDGMTNDRFGWSVAISGKYAIVGTFLNETLFSGAAYIFIRDGTNWSQQTKLTASDSATNDSFGQSVALDGDYALVGAANKKSVYVFLRDGSNWIEQAKITHNERSGADFGASIALDGNYAVVGARFHSLTNVVEAGAAFVFVRSGTNWSQQAIFTAIDAGTRDNFGVSVSIDSSYILVGAEKADATSGLEGAGAAYIYQLRR